MKPSEFKISISVESYDEKTAENCRNYYVAEKRIVFKPSKISFANSISTMLLFDDNKVKMARKPRKK